VKGGRRPEGKEKFSHLTKRRGRGKTGRSLSVLKKRGETGVFALHESEGIAGGRGGEEVEFVKRVKNRVNYWGILSGEKQRRTG